MRNRKRRETIYLDTSVVGAYFDERMPERQALTREFWKKLKEFDIFISELVLDELRRIRDKKLQRVVLNLVKGFEKLDSTPEVEDLALEYTNEKVIPTRFQDDAFHVALASIHGVDYLVSWNFKHLVNVRTKRLVNLVNLKKGFRPIEIIAPPEL